MDIQEIEITIDKNGQVQLHVRGVKGMECIKITQPLEEVLGGEVLLRELTPEAQEKPGNTNQISSDLKNSA